jgi:F0F1-type ATP synthase membrane subunit b/b'
MAGLESEIAALRDASRQELEQENARMQADTARQLDKIRQHAEQEISAALKAARMELKVYSADLAVSLAERKLRAELTGDFDRALVGAYLADLNRQKPSREVQ